MVKIKKKKKHNKSFSTFNISEEVLIYYNFKL